VQKEKVCAGATSDVIANLIDVDKRKEKKVLIMLSLAQKDFISMEQFDRVLKLLPNIHFILLSCFLE